jgi:hypothetical protein
MKLYVVVRADLPPAQQAVQAGHALAEFGIVRPIEFRTWRNGTLVYLAVPGELDVLALGQALEHHGEAFALNREPDLENAATSAAFVLRAGSPVIKSVRALSLALKS